MESTEQCVVCVIALGVHVSLSRHVLSNLEVPWRHGAPVAALPPQEALKTVMENVCIH